MDVVGLHQEGVDYAVGGMGAGAQSESLSRLWNRIDTLYICLDGDAAGLRGAHRSLLQAAASVPDGKRIVIVSLPDGMDPDEYVLEHGKEVFEARLRHPVFARSLATFLIDHAVAEAKGDPCGDPESQARFSLAIEEVAKQFVNAPLIRKAIEREGEKYLAAGVIQRALSDTGLSAEDLERALMTLHEAQQSVQLIRTPKGPSL
jgi:DNA primase